MVDLILSIGNRLVGFVLIDLYLIQMKWKKKRKKKKKKKKRG